MWVRKPRRGLQPQLWSACIYTGAVQTGLPPWAQREHDNKQPFSSHQVTQQWITGTEAQAYTYIYVHTCTPDMHTHTQIHTQIFHHKERGRRMGLYQNVTWSYLWVVRFLYFYASMYYYLYLLFSWLVVKERWLILDIQTGIMVNAIQMCMGAYVFVHLYICTHVNTHTQ